MIYVGLGNTWCVDVQRVCVLDMAMKFLPTPIDHRTPGHMDLCSSLGHNLMAFAEPGTHSLCVFMFFFFAPSALTEISLLLWPGSSAFWFMASTADAPRAESFWKSLHDGQQNIYFDTYLANPYTELVNADFDIFVIEQKVGDFVIVPSNCCHQVNENSVDAIG